MARRIARGEVSAREVVAAHIARIEAVDGLLNAVVVRRFEAALAEAGAADAAQARGERLGLLHGVPVTVKECFHVAGTQATIGLERLKGNLSKEDGILVSRLRRAGAIILGKTNLPQMMIWHECDNPVYGRTNNPWDLDRTPGGSTGGEAAIIAARGSPLGLGNDLGGSIRVPCHFCGIHGLKPTSFRLPRGGAVATLRGMDAIYPQPGPMARRVEDLALSLKVLSDDADGYVAGTVAPGTIGNWEEVDVSRLKVALWTDDGVMPASDAIARAVREAGEILRSLRARVDEIEPAKVKEQFGTSEAFDIYCGLLGSDGGADARRVIGESPLDWRVARLVWLAGLRPLARFSLVAGLNSTGQKSMARLLAAARGRSADGYWQLSHQKNELVARAFASLKAGGYDIVICPPHALPAPQHGKPIDLIMAASYAYWPNLLGLPAGVVPISRVREDEQAGRPDLRDQVFRQAKAVDRGSSGLPVGVQVVGLPWQEAEVLSVMNALEAATQGNADYPGRVAVPSAT